MGAVSPRNCISLKLQYVLPYSKLFSKNTKISSIIETYGVFAMFFDCKRKFGLGVGVFRLSDVLFAQEGMEIVVRLGFGGNAQFFPKPVDVGFYRTGGFLGHGGDFFGVYVDGQ